MIANYRGWILSRFKKFILVIIVLIAVSIVVMLKALSFLRPLDSDPQKITIIDVAPGMTYNSLIPQLLKSGALAEDFPFRVFLKIYGSSRPLKVGEYEVYYHMAPQELLSILSSGKSIERKFTIVEGANINDVAFAFEKAGIAPSTEVLARLVSKRFVKEMAHIELPSLEGYLYPETYSYTKYETADVLIRRMVKKALEVQAQLFDSKKTTLNREQWVVLASIVEKETGAKFERPLIARVFLNRLAQNMKLQTDPTVIYSKFIRTGMFPKNISRDDLRYDHVYNTYMRAGLPPSPISNPGKEALLAVLNPAEGEALFFVSRNDGTHVFSKTYEEHQRAVDAFQKNSRAREGKSWRDLKQ